MNTSTLAPKAPLSAEELYAHLKDIDIGNSLCRYTLERCETLAPQVNRILKLKQEKNALILAHTYVHPDILYGVADHVGDSYYLSKMAQQAEEPLILFPAVRFMAETAKILNPKKTVLDPNPNGGCSLADSISAKEVNKLREEYPDYTFVCYINCTAEVKAACDVCVTSSNVYKVIRSLPNENIYFLPDALMGKNIVRYLEKEGCKKNLRYYQSGTCYVHEQFSKAQVEDIRKLYPEVKILAHPECKPEVIELADVIDSTGGMIQYVKDHTEEKRPFFLLTECGVSARLQSELPQSKLVGGCMLCKYMKSNSLTEIIQALESPSPAQEITIPPEIAKKALASIEAMFFYADS